MADIVNIGGELLTLIYPIIEKEGGPPFAVSIDAVRDLLVPVGFEPFQLEYLPLELCHEGRNGENGSPRSAIGRWRRVVKLL